MEAERESADSNYTEAVIVAQGIAKAAQLLTNEYQWVITNVPYLARGKQDKVLQEFAEQHYPEGKNDLATIFLDRCLDFCVKGGVTSIVLPQNWLFLTSYRKFREKLLKRDTWNLVVRLGARAFEMISGEVVQAVLITLTKGQAFQADGLFADKQSAAHKLRGLDVSEERTAADKDRKSTRLNSSHVAISYAVFCLKKKLSSISLQKLSLRISHSVRRTLSAISKEETITFRKPWKPSAWPLRKQTRHRYAAPAAHLY